MFTPSFNLDALANLQDARVHGTDDEYQRAIEALYASCTAAPVICDTTYSEAMHDAAYPYRAIGRTVLYLPTGRPVKFGGFDTRERARRVAATLNRVRQ